MEMNYNNVMKIIEKHKFKKLSDWEVSISKVGDMLYYKNFIFDDDKKCAVFINESKDYPHYVEFVLNTYNYKDYKVIESNVFICDISIFFEMYKTFGIDGIK